jgi:hypothetical protein
MVVTLSPRVSLGSRGALCVCTPDLGRCHRRATTGLPSSHRPLPSRDSLGPVQSPACAGSEPLLPASHPIFPGLQAIEVIEDCCGNPYHARFGMELATA